MHEYLDFLYMEFESDENLGQIRGNGSRGLSLAGRCVLFGLNVVFKIFGSYVNIVKSVEFA